MSESHENNMQLAVDLHQQGRLAEAANVYQSILRTEPRNFEALHLLGCVALQNGQTQHGWEIIEHSLTLNPQQPLALLNSGNALQRLGRMDQALTRYESALRLQPDLAPALTGRGQTLLHLGRPAEALTSARQALDMQPDNPAAQELCGTALMELQRHEEAVECYQRLLRASSGNAPVLNNLGNALLVLGRASEALESYERALQLDPNYTKALNNRGGALLELGQPQEALQSIERALQLDPMFALAHNNHSRASLALRQPLQALTGCQRALEIDPNLWQAHFSHGMVLQALGRFPAAADAYARTAHLNPGSVEAWVNRAEVLLQLRRPEEALACSDRALALRGDAVEAHNNRGRALCDLQRLEDALVSYQAALQLRQDFLPALSNLGTVLAALDRHEDAAECFQQALALDPHYAPALNNLGSSLTSLARYAQAAECFARLLEIAPNHDYALGSLFHARAHCCEWRDYELEVKRLEQGVTQGRALVDPFTFLTVSESPAAQLACARLFTTRRFPQVAAAQVAALPGESRKLRLGYVSADFHDHATPRLMAGLIEAHDRQRFEVIGISIGPDDRSEMRLRLSRAFDRLIDVRDRSDDQVAALIRDLGIDVLIDLKGYTAGCRPGILARRPAPIQVSYLGYPGTMGAPYLDYIVADRHVIPPQDQPHYAESVVYLPECYQVNDRHRPIAREAPSRTELGLPERGFVFCCFCASYKITPRVYDIWMRLLTAVPGSVLWLLDDNPTATANLRREAEGRAVAADRLIFAPRVGLAEHLARHRRADLFLDTAPYGAHSTASDALWAGLPVLALQGRAFAGRVSSSLLHAIGLPELICTTFADYERLAVELASTPAQLTAIRDRLQIQREGSALFDTARLCRSLEAAYGLMWRHRGGETSRSSLNITEADIATA